MPLVIVNVAPVLEQAPALENVTALPEPPPVAATVKLVLKTALAGACGVTLIAWSALFTVSEREPLLGSKRGVAGERGADAGRVRARVDPREADAR